MKEKKPKEIPLNAMDGRSQAKPPLKDNYRPESGQQAGQQRTYNYFNVNRAGKKKKGPKSCGGRFFKRLDLLQQSGQTRRKSSPRIEEKHGTPFLGGHLLKRKINTAQKENTWVYGGDQVLKFPPQSSHWGGKIHPAIENFPQDPSKGE